MEYYVLSKDFGNLCIYLEKIKASDEQKAWDIVEESIQTNMSQDWLFTKEQLTALKKLINEVA